MTKFVSYVSDEAIEKDAPGASRGICAGVARPAQAPKVSVAPAHATDADALVLAETPEPQPLVLDANGVDLDLKAATAALSRETSGIGDDKDASRGHYGLTQGQIVEQTGPDGSIKRVRIVAAPTLK
jgi:hypothetical protein